MSGKWRDVLVYWLPPLLWMALIFTLSAQPDLPHAPGPWFDTLIKKSAHAVAFGTLTWLYLRLGRRYRLDRGWALWGSAGLAFLYAVSDEFHQTFVPGRSGRLMDVAIDILGILIAIGLWRWLARRRSPAPHR